MKLGLIGCGTVALGGHLPAIAESTDFKLAALSDVRADHLEEVGKRYGVERLYTDYRELLAHEDIDAVTITTPVGSHYSMALAALAAGKHVFCEKPLADTLEHGRELVEAAERAKRILAVNFELRAAEPYMKVKEIVDSGELGKVLFMRLIYNWPGGRWAGLDRYRLLMTEGKGPIFNCGVHFFDLARWYSDSEFTDVEASGIYMEAFPYPDHVVAVCRMANGAVVVVDESWVFGHSNTELGYTLHRIDLEGERGTVTAELVDGVTEVSVVSSDRVWTQRYPYSKPFGSMYGRLAQSIATGRIVGLASGEDGLKAVEVAEASLSSVARKSPD